MKTLILNCNPKINSLCEYIEKTFLNSLNTADAKVIRLKSLSFNYNYEENGVDENDVIMSRHEIASADHLVFIFPLWWGSFPALMKAFIDRVFSSGFAYRYVKGKQIPGKLLTGKTARIIITMDSPVWYYRFIKQARAEKQLKNDILSFCGIKTVEIIRIGNVRNKGSNELKVEINNLISKSLRL